MLKMNEIVTLRNKMNAKRRNFYKQGAHKKKRLEKKWKFPRGCDSKIAIERKGYPKRVKVGYRGPAEARGLSKDGFMIVFVRNLNDLKKIDKTKSTVCIASIGMKKKIEIVKECVKLGLRLLNLKNPEKFLIDFEQSLKKKDMEKAQKEKEKTKKSAESKSKTSKDGIEAKIDKEDEKKEKDKILTKREI